MTELGNWPLKRITPELITRLESAAKNGRTVKLAAQAAEIPPGILRRWLEMGEELYLETGKRDEPVAELFVRYSKASAGFKARLQDQLTSAGAGKESSPGSAGWQLERLERDDFGTSTKLEVTGPEGGPLLVEGRAAVGWADFAAIARANGYASLLGLEEPVGSDREALPRAGEVLPDPAEPERSADAPPGVPGS